MSNFLEIAAGYSFKDKSFSTYQQRITGSRFYYRVINQSGLDGTEIANMNNIIGVGREHTDNYAVTRLEITNDLFTQMMDRFPSIIETVSLTSGGYYEFTLLTKVTADGRLGISIKDYENNGIILHYNSAIDKFDSMTTGIIPNNDAIFIMETSQRSAIPTTSMTGTCVPYYFYASYDKMMLIKLQVQTTSLSLIRSQFSGGVQPLGNADTNGYFISNTLNPAKITKLVIADTLTAQKVENLEQSFTTLEQEVDQAINDISDISNATREYYVSR